MQLMSEKFTREQLEVRLGCDGKEATAAIRDLFRGGQLQAQLTPIDPFTTAKRQRTYVFVAQQVEMLRDGEAS